MEPVIAIASNFPILFLLEIYKDNVGVVQDVLVP